MAIEINKLTNCNVYVDGTSFMGRAEEIDVPEINFKMAEHKSLGLFGTFDVPSGLDKMEARIKWNALYPEVLANTGNPYKAHQLMVRASLERYTSEGRTAQVPAVFTMTGMCKNLPSGKFKQHDNIELETKWTVTRCKLTIDGQTIYEVDVMANIFTVGDEDVLAEYRNNVGS